MMCETCNELGRADRDGIDRVSRIGIAIQVILDAIQCEVVVWKVPGEIKADLAVVPDRSKAIFLQQKEAVDETDLRGVSDGFGRQLDPVAVAGVQLELLTRMIVSEVKARAICTDDGIVDQLVGRLQPDAGPRPRRAPDV